MQNPAVFSHSGESQVARNRIYITLTKVQPGGYVGAAKHSHADSILPTIQGGGGGEKCNP